MSAEPVSIHALVIAARERLVEAGVAPSNASIDSEVLARGALGWDRARYVADRGMPPPDGFTAQFDAWIERRREREPVAQILGRREFWGLDFAVTRDVLTPRPETELVVEEVLARIGPAPAALRVADVGTGSGILAIALAVEWPACTVVATDISAEALLVAAGNAAAHGVTGRVRFVRTSLLEGLTGPFDVIVSNPPYVPDGARRALSRDVSEYEPSVALFGGADGFDLIKALLAQAVGVLASGGLLVHEFGAGQDLRMQAAADGALGLELLTIRDDLQHIPRVAVFRKT